MTLSYFFDKILELAKINLQTDFRAIINWFFKNYMILNSEKCHYIASGKTVRMINLYIMRKSIKQQGRNNFESNY